MGETKVTVGLGIDEDESGADPLAVIKGIRRGMEGLEDAIRRQVRMARRRGHSWQEIADALGVSRQAAWEQFHAEAPDRAEVIADVLGSLAGPGGPSEEIREREREGEAEAEERRSS